MGERGPARRPNLQVVKEGNPGKRPLSDLDGGVRLRPEAPDEPSWAQVWPSARGNKDQQAFVKRLRGWSSDEWNRIVPVLNAQGLLATVDLTVLLEHCTAVALSRECLRDIGLNGLTMQGERGQQKNGATTVLNQQHAKLKHTTGHLGLTPVARDALSAPGVDDGDDPFD